MHDAAQSHDPSATRHRPATPTVFGAAFVAGAVAAFGINSFFDAHVARTRPQVESEPIFVALRSLPQGAPVTVWDVALRDWPRAMLPESALRAEDRARA
jgi:Flp pilus assembly protein CpaB